MSVLCCGDALDYYQQWPSPTCIISDGPYGVAGYPGDPPTVDGLYDWYTPHVQAWSAAANPQTTLWFWGTEVSWASVHPLLLANGWKYRMFCLWDKGIGHIAGNVNSNTIRGFPVVSEACVQYVRDVQLPTVAGEMLPLQAWFRQEWQRSGLPFSAANKACGVKNAASRKYFAADHLWYLPPNDMLQQLRIYANKHGKPTDHPYFCVDGQPIVSQELTYKWRHQHGLTNVWHVPALKGKERLQHDSGVLHTNQKPLALMEQLVVASSDPGDTIWEPFAGLASASVAAQQLERSSYGAEINPAVYEQAVQRLG